jgi:hypothetical protein
LQSGTRLTRRFLAAAVGIGALAVVLAAVAHPTGAIVLDAAQATPTAVPGTSATGPSGPSTASPTPKADVDVGTVRQPQPPDGKWLTDKDGRQYYVDKIKKPGIYFLRLPNGQVRTLGGIVLDVVKEDDQFFYAKMYRVDPKAHGPVRKFATPTAEELAAVAASYKVDIPTEHRLRFTNFGLGLPTAGQWREGFDIADMNGDGQLDVVHGVPRKGTGTGTPIVFLGDGKGNWKRWQGMKFPEFPFDYGDIKAADLKGDGHLGLVLGIHLHGITAMAGDGKGHFEDWNKGLDFALPKDAPASPFSSRAIAVVDWNHDGRPDILAFGEGPRLDRSGARVPGQFQGSGSDGPVLYLNQGDGSWKRVEQGTSSHEGFGDGIAVGDFNGDGKPDFVTTTSIAGFSNIVHVQRADGGWDNEDPSIRPSAYVGSVATGDFDHAGRSALVAGFLSFELGIWRTGVEVYFPKPEGKWDRRLLFAEEGKSNVYAINTGDVDGDGNLDVVAVTGDGRTLIFYGDGKGSFVRETAGIPNFPGGCRGSHVQLADLDKDGKAEIVTSFAGEGSAVHNLATCPSGGAITAWHSAPPTPGDLTPAAVPPAPPNPPHQTGAT